jgi:hypothetical protein
MFLGTEGTKPLEIGGRYTGIWLTERVPVPDEHYGVTRSVSVFYAEQPYVVLREATAKEWCNAPHREWGWSRERVKKPSDPYESLYYEVSLD